MSEFLNTRAGQKCLNDIARIADSLESIAKALKPLGDYMETNKELMEKTAKIQLETIKNIEQEMEADLHEPGC